MLWKHQAPAWVGSFALASGLSGAAVLTGSRNNPNSVVIAVIGKNDARHTLSLENAMALLPPSLIAEIICMQERAFGNAGLPAPDWA